MTVISETNMEKKPVLREGEEMLHNFRMRVALTRRDQLA